jgi:hypothetical protein
MSTLCRNREVRTITRIKNTFLGSGYNVPVVSSAQKFLVIENGSLGEIEGTEYNLRPCRRERRHA